MAVIGKKIEFSHCKKESIQRMESMDTTKMVTAAEILEERNRQRNAGILAHTANMSLIFYPRDGCPCYTCRDALDPTGEVDAKIKNDSLIDLPREQPKLERQYATCSSCEEQHSCETKCNGRPAYLNLPPPSVALRSIAAPSGLISPFIGLISPRSLSDASVTIEDQTQVCEEMETKVKRYLKRLLKEYEKLQSMIETNNSDARHDEMAANDVWWTEVDRKKSSTEDLLELLD